MSYDPPPLIKAMIGQHSHEFSNCLRRGDDPNVIDADGRTPIICAAIDNQIAFAREVISYGAAINSADIFGNTALHYASQEYNLEFISLLLQHGANLEAEDMHGNTPLSTAVFYSMGRGGAISLLLTAGADRNHANKYGVTPIGLAQTIANYDVKQYFE